MPVDGGLTPVASAAGAKIPNWLRLTVAAMSGATLSLSFTGLYLSIYSWICVGVLLLTLIGATSRVAFGCGLVHALLFVLTSVGWIAAVLSVHGGLSVAGGWGILLLIAAVWGLLIGGFTLTVHRISRRSIELACLAAPFAWVTFEFIRAHLPEISFPWNLLGYPASANLGLLQIATVTGIYGLSFLAAGFNAVVAWFDAARTPSIARRLTTLCVSGAAILVVMFFGPRLTPISRPPHT